MSQGSDANACEAANVIVVAHSIANIPSAVQRVDPARTSFRLVVQGLLRFVPPEVAGAWLLPLQLDENGAGSGGTTTTSSGSRELPALTASFSPASVLFRDAQFGVKFETRELDYSAVTASSDSSSSSSSSGGGGGRAGRGVAGGNSSVASSEKSGGPTARRLSAASQPADARHAVHWRVARGTSVPASCVAVLDVFVGVQEMRNSSGSGSSRWITTPPHSARLSHEKFAISAAQIGTNVVTTRVVGTSFGQVALCLWAADLDAPERRKARIERLAAAMPGAFSRPPITSVSDALAVSELEATNHMRRAADEEFYEREVRTFAVPYLHHKPAVLEAKLAQLAEWRGREDFFIRGLIAELGPDARYVPPRLRLKAFMRINHMPEQDVSAATAGLSIEGDTEAFFDALQRHHDMVEPAPSRYLFPTPVYEPDERACLLEHLSFPANKGGKNSRDVALAARQKRKAFFMSPLERETEVRVNRRQLSEIEILQQKHEPEFRQVVPAVADALTNVVEQHRSVAAGRHTRDDRFHLYDTDAVPRISLDDYVHRISEYTFISPASLIGALMLIDRACERHHSLLLTDRNVFKLFFVAVRVASKVIDLRTLNNANFAKVGGVSNQQLNDVEEGFLKHLKFDLFIGPVELFEYAKRIAPPTTLNRVPRALPGQPTAATKGSGTGAAEGVVTGKVRLPDDNCGSVASATLPVSSAFSTSGSSRR